MLPETYAFLYLNLFCPPLRKTVSLGCGPFLFFSPVFGVFRTEFTTMAGRRLRDAVKTVLSSGSKGENLHVVIAGLTNSYSQYVTTFKEYEVQRYEVSSCLQI